MTTPPELKAAAAAGDPVALTRVLVATPSVNPSLEEGGTGEGEAARICAGWLQGWGFRTEILEGTPGRPSVVGRRGSGAPTLLLNGHLDTVGVAGMSIPPFLADVRDGAIHGRGACDMKGGVGALLAVAATLAREEHAGTLLVVLTSDEEHASLGAAEVVEAGVTADAAVVCEPTGLAVMPAHKGFQWVEAHFRGRAAHGSRPDRGVDAIRHAGLLLAALGRVEAGIAAAPPHPLLGRGSLHAGTIRGGSAPSVYPDSCRLVLERRTLPGDPPGVFLDELRGVVDALRRDEPEMSVELELTLTRPGTEVPGESPLVQGLLDGCRRMGVPPRVEPMTAWVDGAIFNEAGIPAVCFGPGSIGDAHSAAESVPVEEVRNCARVLESFARSFLGGSVG